MDVSRWMSRERRRIEYSKTENCLAYTSKETSNTNARDPDVSRYPAPITVRMGKGLW